VKKYLEKQDNLYISLDESNDVANNKIINIFIITERGVFYYKNINLNTIAITAEFYTEKIKQRTRLITKGQLKRINFILTDICDTMLKTARLL
jgi:hypothetical protein